MPNYAIGIDLGGTKILTGLVNKGNGEVLYSIKQKTGKEKDAETIVEKLKLSIKELLETSHFDIAQIDSIGIGAPGQVDRDKGILVSAPNLNCENLNLKAIMEREFYIPTFIGNDVEIATLGEMKFGAGKDYNDFVCIFVGTGIGSGIACDGKSASRQLQAQQVKLAILLLMPEAVHVDAVPTAALRHMLHVLLLRPELWVR